MRIEQLLEREPFGQILVSTLEQYWMSRTGIEHNVIWYESASRFRKTTKEGYQSWFGNAYLNYFSVADTPSQVLETLRREYSRSRLWWHRLPQILYVECATRTPTRRWFSQVAFDVRPHIHRASEQVILGGNRRIRILDPSSGISTVILKQGYPARYLDAEIALRKQLALDFSPRLGTMSLRGGWYDEEFVSGTPLNRLNHKSRGKYASRARMNILTGLVEPTLAWEPFREHVDNICEGILSLSSKSYVPPPLGSLVTDLISFVNHFLLRFEAQITDIPISNTHGDLQPSNILVSDRGVITIIDWESTDRRHAAYDLLVSILNTRHTSDWCSRLDSLIYGSTILSTHRWPGLNGDIHERTRTIYIFLLEELQFVLTEYWEVSFIHDTSSLLSRITQISRSIRWLSDSKKWH